MHEKRIRKGMKLSILAGLLALIMAMTAFADPVLDMGNTGEITVTMQTEDENGTLKTISGGTMAIYKVADVYGVGGTESTGGGYYFRLTDNFKDSGVELEGKTDDDLSGKWSEYAEKLADFADENSVKPDETKSIGADGTAVFGNLSAGLYLLVQTEPAEGYSSVNPFLVSMPYYEDGVYKTSVETYPKTGPAEERHYYDIDEEIVADMDDIWDRDAWIPSESVNEYEAIEIEMTTYLPTISGHDVAHGEITMNFHEVLDPELLIDDRLEDFSVYIAGQEIPDDYYDVIVASGVSPASIQPFAFTVVDSIDDGCTFHVVVDLTALYNDGIVTDDMLLGDTEITIFFYVDLETVDEKNHYASTIWYQIFDGYDEETREWLYTSSVVEVYVYTFEIDIAKTNSSTDAPLAGATFAIYTDEGCTIPFVRNGSAYSVTSAEDGMVIFYGLAAGTYYVKETDAPNGFILSDDIFTVTLGDDMDGYIYNFSVVNTPSSSTSSGGHHSTGGGGGGGGGSSSGSGGTTTGGPGSGDDSSDGDSGTNIWDLLPLPQTGQGWALMIAICAMIVAGVGLIVAYTVKRGN